jgi:hypothetical protein
MSLGETPRLVVVVNSWLSGSAAYLLADPQESPVFVRSFPEGSGPLRPDIGRISATVYDETGAPLVYDGQAYLFEHIFGIAAVDRQGIVKLTAAS